MWKSIALGRPSSWRIRMRGLPLKLPIFGKHTCPILLRHIRVSGQVTIPSFFLKFWEQRIIEINIWIWVQTAAERTGFIDGSNSILYWEEGRGRYFRHAMSLKAEGLLGGWKSGKEAWWKSGFIVNVTQTPHVDLYLVSARKPRNLVNLKGLCRFFSAKIHHIW